MDVSPHVCTAGCATPACRARAAPDWSGCATSDRDGTLHCVLRRCVRDGGPGVSGTAATRRRVAAGYPVRRSRHCRRVLELVSPSWFIEPSVMLPGRLLHRLAAHICSTNTLERVVEPAIADLQNELFAVYQRNVFRRVTVLV